MRILYSHYLAAEDHPAVRMVQSIAAELRHLGHEVLIHRSEPLKDSAHKPAAAPRGAGGGSLRSVRRRLWFARAVAENVGGYRRDAAAVQAFGPDVVLARQDAYRYSMPLSCSRLGVPLVTFADAPVAYETRHVNPSGRWHPPRLVESIERWGLRRSRAAVTVSNPAAGLLERYALNLPIHVAPNGVDADRFRPSTESERAETRRRLGVATPRVAGFVGTFQPFHGLNLLGDLVRLTADRTDLTWLLVGDGVGRQKLEADLKGHPRVVFAGRQPPERVAEASRRDGHPRGAAAADGARLLLLPVEGARSDGRRRGLPGRRPGRRATIARRRPGRVSGADRQAGGLGAVPDVAPGQQRRAPPS